MDRRTTVQNNLAILLDNQRKTKPYMENLEDSQNGDFFALNVEGKVEEIKQLKQQVDEYRNDGLHFTKQYRTLEGHCGKLLMELDRVVVFGRDDLKTSKNQALREVDVLINALHKKAHANGKVCDRCEVQY